MVRTDQIGLFIFILLIQTLHAQQFLKRSTCLDTLGLSDDLKKISDKLGPLNDTVYKNLECLEVQYLSRQNNNGADSLVLNTGVLLVHRSVKEDLKNIFEELLLLKFPIHSVIPINKFGLNADSSGWNDAASMQANNSSAFNYRLITLSKDLSPHAFGTAIDINPMQNPYEKYVFDGKFIEPETAVYNPSIPGTIADGPVVGLFDQRGWVWGGRWNNPVDYQHFDLRKDRGRKHYLMKESVLKLYFSQSDVDGIISLYATKQDRKSERPELTIKYSEKRAFERCMDLFGHNCTDQWKDKNVYDTLFLSKKNLNNFSETHVEIEFERQGMHRDLNLQTALVLIKKLKRAGFNAFLKGSENIVADISLSLEIGNTEIAENEEMQLIYVPGAYKEKEMSEKKSRLDFLNSLISDDLPNSIKLAQNIQQFLSEDIHLKPLDRQIAGPNILQDDCIKSDVDGIYSRNLPFFGGKHCPQIFISILGNRKANNLLNDSTKVNDFCNALADSILKGIIQYCKAF